MLCLAERMSWSRQAADRLQLRKVLGRELEEMEVELEELEEMLKMEEMDDMQ